MFLRRQVVFLVSFVALAGSALEIAVSRQISSNFEKHQGLCRAYLCEGSIPLADAYRQQIHGTTASVEIASQILLDSLVRDPASAYRWLDLGQALAQAGRRNQASYCMARAVRLGGTSADVALAAGDFYLLYGDRHEGLRYLSQTLRMTRGLDQAVFSLFTARDISVDDALNDGMPVERLPARAYLRYLVDRREIPGSEKIWRWMVDRRLNDQQTTIEYSNFLFAERQFVQAAEEWASVPNGITPDYRSKQHLFNGDFANEPLPGAIFDWKIAPLDHVSVNRDCEPQPDGCLLRIQFDGSANVDFNNVSQIVVLEPGKYLFRVGARTAELTTDQGLVFEIQDGENAGRLNVESRQLKGTSDWQDIELAFTVSPATNFITVSVRRHPSLRFDNKINGTGWIRHASLAQVR